MTPLTIALLATGGIGLLTLLWYLLRRRKQGKQPSQLPSPQADAGNGAPQLPSPPQPQDSGPPQPVRPPRLTTAETVQEVVSHVAFSRQRVLVGHKTVGHRQIGQIAEESPYPADDILVRPISDMGELPSMLPSERTSDPATRMIRSITGQSLVMANLERRPITEPITEPIYREGKRVLYLLLDVSGSMGEENSEWKIPLWRGITLFLVRRCLNERATIMLRTFTDSVGDLESAETEQAMQRIEALVRQLHYRGGTDIGKAIGIAIEDLKREAFDQKELMIVTDGEDKNFSEEAVRRELDAAGIKLHAVLLGAQNATLRECADVYQEVLENGILKPPVKRCTVN